MCWACVWTKYDMLHRDGHHVAKHLTTPADNFKITCIYILLMISRYCTLRITLPYFTLRNVGCKLGLQKFIHAISPTPASTMSAVEISTKPLNTTLSPYTYTDQTVLAKEATKRPSDSDADSQYWRYDVSQKRQKYGAGDGDRLCFKFVSSGSCPRGDKCNFQHDENAREQSLRGVCFDFLNKGRCERGPNCNFKHSLQDEGESYSHKKRGSENASNRLVFFFFFEDV